MNYCTLNNKRKIIADCSYIWTLEGVTTEVTEYLASASEGPQCRPCKLEGRSLKNCEFFVIFVMLWFVFFWGWGELVHMTKLSVSDVSVKRLYNL